MPSLDSVVGKKSVKVSITQIVDQAECRIDQLQSFQMSDKDHETSSSHKSLKKKKPDFEQSLLTPDEAFAQWLDVCWEKVWRRSEQSNCQEFILTGFLASFCTIFGSEMTLLEKVLKELKMKSTLDVMDTKEQLNLTKLMAVLIILMNYEPTTCFRDNLFWRIIDTIEATLFGKIIIRGIDTLAILHNACSRAAFPRTVILEKEMDQITNTYLSDDPHWLQIEFRGLHLSRSKLSRIIFVSEILSNKTEPSLIHPRDEVLQIDFLWVQNLSDTQLIEYFNKSDLYQQDVSLLLIFNPKDYHENLPNRVFTLKGFRKELKTSNISMESHGIKNSYDLISDPHEKLASKERRHSLVELSLYNDDKKTNCPSQSVNEHDIIAKPWKNHIYTKMSRFLHLQSKYQNEFNFITPSNPVSSNGSLINLNASDHTSSIMNHPPQCKEKHHLRFRKISAQTTLATPHVGKESLNNRRLNSPLIPMKTQASSAHGSPVHINAKWLDDSYDSLLNNPLQEREARALKSETFEFNLTRCVTVYLIIQNKLSDRTLTLGQDALDLDSGITFRDHKISKKISNVSKLMRRRNISTIDHPNENIHLNSKDDLDVSLVCRSIHHSSQENMRIFCERKLIFKTSQNITSSKLLEKSLATMGLLDLRNVSNSFLLTSSSIMGYSLMKRVAAADWKPVTLFTDPLMTSLKQYSTQFLIVPDELCVLSMPMRGEIEDSKPVNLASLNISHLAAHLYALSYSVLRSIRSSDLIIQSSKSSIPVVRSQEAMEEKLVDLASFSNRLQEWVQQELLEIFVANDCDESNQRPTLSKVTKAHSEENCGRNKSMERYADNLTETSSHSREQIYSKLESMTKISISSQKQRFEAQNKVLKQFLQLCIDSAALGDLETVFILLCSIECNQSKQNSNLWNKCPRQLLKKLQPLRQYLITSGNMKNLRSWHDELSLGANGKDFFPFIPVIGLLFKDLAVMDELEDTWVQYQSENRVNFAKMCRMSERCENFLTAIRSSRQFSDWSHRWMLTAPFEYVRLAAFYRIVHCKTILSQKLTPRFLNNWLVKMDPNSLNKLQESFIAVENYCEQFSLNYQNLRIN